MSENVTPSSPHMAGSQRGSVSSDRGSTYSHVTKTGTVLRNRD